MRAPLASTLSTLTDKDKSEILRDAYKKHAAELLALESSQVQLTTLVLGVFAAGASFLGAALGHDKRLPLTAKIGLTVVVIALMSISWVFSKFRSNARIGIRGILVNVEQALLFYQDGAYVQCASLYSPDLIEKFPSAGNWLGLINWLVVLAAVGVLVLIWAM